MMNSKCLQEELSNIYALISKLEIQSNPNNVQILYTTFYKLREVINQLENEKDTPIE